METKTYNGWANYETWSVMLFIENESNACIHEATRAARRGAGTLREWFEDYFLTDPATDQLYGNIVVQQFMSAAMGEVEWRECVDHLLYDADDETESDDEE